MIRLFDTAKQNIVPFEPGELVTLYTCGITPYDSAHLGHAATYLYYDVLQRRLRDLGHRTQCVRNVTDIDEPLFEKARQLGVDWKELGDRELANFQQVMDALNILPAFSEPRATESIPDVLGFIGMVMEAGFAYEANGSVYFDVSSWPRFGEVSHYSEREMLALAAERGGNVDDASKRNPLDFVLWQPSADDEPSWPSLWGDGRPGWHIECSALAMRELGETIDLHGGGTDLIFPHHECEAAQSQAATGELFVRHWMHVGMVRMNGEKMSKSLGNLIFVRDLLEKFEPQTVRLGVLAHHYRRSWEWNDNIMPRAHERLQLWRASGGNGSAFDNGSSDDVLEDVRHALDDDLDTPLALSILDAAARHDKDVTRGAALLGVEL